MTLNHIKHIFSDWFVHQPIDEWLHNVPMLPSSWVKSKSRAALSIDEKFLEIPRDITRFQWIPHQLLAFAKCFHCLWAGGLKYRIEEIRETLRKMPSNQNPRYLLKMNGTEPIYRPYLSFLTT